MTRKRQSQETDPPHDDAALWRHVASTAKPLPKTAVAPASPAPVVARPAPPKARLKPLPRPQPVAIVAKAAPPTGGIDKRTGNRLRRGEMQIEARLDLHGMTAKEAHRAARDFLVRAHAAGLRCVLVVTGKGQPRDTGGIMTPARGVLRAEFPRWLGQAGLREIIVSSTPATPRDGGDGAFYVLLRRHRAAADFPTR
jgi:DNA-nicking Smr family endonuclease